VKSKSDDFKNLRERNNILNDQLIQQGYKPEPTEVVVPTKGGK